MFILLLCLLLYIFEILNDKELFLEKGPYKIPRTQFFTNDHLPPFFSKLKYQYSGCGGFLLHKQVHLNIKVPETLIFS